MSSEDQFMLENDLTSTTLCALSSPLPDGGCVPKKEMPDVSDDIKKQCAGDSVDQEQACILQKDNSRESKRKIVLYFKPATKSYSSSYWLNNTEVDHIQYHLCKKFKGYYYSNIHMIDLKMFSPHNEDYMDAKVFPLCGINFVEELDGKGVLSYNGELKSFGCVVNTDVSSGGGIHWFSIFFDFSTTPYTIEYFNSSGLDIKNIKFKKYLLALADKINLNKAPCVYVRATDIQHQSHSTSNCGVYSLYYIWRRLNGTPHAWFSKNKVSDKAMTLFRRFLFSKESPVI